MRKAFKYRLYGNKAAFAKADDWLYLCRRLYNAALEQRIMAYKQNHGQISDHYQSSQLPDLKKAFPEYHNVGSQILQDVIERLDKAYQAFFRRVKKGDKAGFPRFKSKDRYNSFTLKQAGWKIDGRYLFIRNIGKFKLKLSRPIEGNIKTVTIRREPTDKWFVYFSCDNVPEHKLPKLVKVVGIDVGIKYFLADSEGSKVENPKYLRKSEILLRRRQRVLSRRVKGSHGRHKARVLVAKTHERIFNQRKDFLHKTANSYIKNYGTLVFEDLNIKGMVKNHHLAKSISDSSWGLFYELCAYKAEEAGRHIIRIPRFEPSSKTCSECGAINHNLKLSDREWVCLECGVLHDRDYNAAKNIRRVGQILQEVTYGNSQSVS
jgi:putative transposase